MAPARTHVAKRKAPQSAGDGKGKKMKALRQDEELSDDDAGGLGDDRSPGGLDSDDDEEEEEEIQETTEEARLRIAKQYLRTVEEEVAKVEDSDDDRETFNQDAIAHRLQQDVAAARGKAFKKVADSVRGLLPDSTGKVVRESFSRSPFALPLHFPLATVDPPRRVHRRPGRCPLPRTRESRSRENRRMLI